MFTACRRDLGLLVRQGVCCRPGSHSYSCEICEKITCGKFVELADLLLANLRAVGQESQTFLDSKLLVSKRRRLVEVEDILTWTEAFTIYQMMMCASRLHRWSDLTKYNHLVVAGSSMALPSARMRQPLVHQTGRG